MHDTRPDPDGDPDGNPTVKALHRRLKEKGKPDKVARIAAARKLLLIAHAIYKSGEPFRDPNQKEA